MIQQGQVFKLKTKGREGQPLWAYRYRLEGRGSVRPQVGGFATRAEALKALEKVLARLGPGRSRGDDDARRVGRGVPGDASGGAGHDGQAALAARQGDRDAWGGQACGSLAEGGVRVAPDDPGGTPLRGDAGASAGARVVRSSGGYLTSNPAKRGVPNQLRRSKEKQPFESWAADRRDRRAAQSRLRADGRVLGRDRTSTLGAVRARAARHRP